MESNKEINFEERKKFKKTSLFYLKAYDKKNLINIKVLFVCLFFFKGMFVENEKKR
jgi:hypothetical protein